MINRRDFLKTGAAIAGSSFVSRSGKLYGNTAASYFTVHPFVESNPNAVFIMKTAVDKKTDASAIKAAGQRFGQSVFQTTDDAATGIPLDYLYAIKPNMTSRGKWMKKYTTEGTMGVVTDANFVEGVIDSMKGVGIGADKIYVREVNGTENMDEGGYGDVANRTGADIQVVRPNYSAKQLQWREVPGGVFFDQIPYLWPVNADKSWLLNISKFKAHGMGLTLCAKNLQGSIASPYQAHCTAHYSNMDIDSKHMKAGAKSTIRDNHRRHKADGIPRWDVSGDNHTGGLGMETWATRCLDNNATSNCGLHVIEGIVGRDGNFVEGPHNGLAKDFMTNIIIFGKNAFYVDIIGHWLGGHEPGNFGLFHMARERGFIETINPNRIPTYEWSESGEATLSSLSNFERTPLLTHYLTKPGEDKWHLVNEAYEYKDATSVSSRWAQPSGFKLEQNYPNPFNPSTSIMFNLPSSGRTRLEIINTHGDVVELLCDEFLPAGSHMRQWNASRMPSGHYFYRLTLEGQLSETRQMVLLK